MRVIGLKNMYFFFIFSVSFKVKLGDGIKTKRLKEPRS